MAARPASNVIVVLVFAGGCAGAAARPRQPMGPATSSTAAMTDSQPPTPDPLQGRTSNLIANLARGDFVGASENFDFTMRSRLPAENLAEAWRNVEGQVGTFVAIERVRTEHRGRYSFGFARCRFERGEKVVKVTYDADGSVAGLFFLDPPAPQAPPAWTVPAYADPGAFDERDVRLGARPELPGALSVPRGPGPFPAVVLVHGSGPSDADETLGQIKVFKDLAFGLASRGVVVLRYAKRTRIDPRGVVTVKEEVIDAVHAAVDLMAATPQVDARRLVVVGHSQGGYLAPRIASEDTRIAGLVILAGNTRPVEDLLVEQLRHLAAPAETIDEALRLRAIVDDPQLAADRPMPALAGGVTGAYFLDLRGYHPEIVATHLTCPMLILRGERDYQVSQADFEGWKKALCGESRAQCKQYPGLNHAFVEGTGPSMPSEYNRPGHVDGRVIEDIALWVRSLPARPGG
jgi:uncharacterized protein